MLHFKTIRSMLAEEVAAPERLGHLEHIEDRALQSGDAGVHHAMNTLQGMHDYLSGNPTHVKVNEKMDGAPSLVWGTNPENGKFFVSTKSWGNKNPKINYTPEDIERNHGHAPGLVEKLKAALEHLPKVTPKGKLYQGDVMYTGNDVMDRGNHYAFTPNTITYKVDKNHPEAQNVARAKIGVAAHTEYSGGQDLGSMRPTFGPSLSGFRKHPDAHIMSTETKPDPKNFSKKDRDEFNTYMDAAREAHANIHPDAHAVAGRHVERLMPYINSEVRRGGRPSHQGLMDFVQERGQKEISKYKTASSVERKSDILNQNLNDLASNKDHIEALLNLHGHIQNAKNVLARVAAKNKKFGTEIQGNESGPEGMVVVDPKKNTIDKAVDRDEFSAANFAKNQAGKFSS